MPQSRVAPGALFLSVQVIPVLAAGAPISVARGASRVQTTRDASFSDKLELRDALEACAKPIASHAKSIRVARLAVSLVV